MWLQLCLLALLRRADLPRGWRGLEFDGEVTTAGGDPQQTIKDQMLFTIGQLNGKTGYHAKLPVSIAKTS